MNRIGGLYGAGLFEIHRCQLVGVVHTILAFSDGMHLRCSPTTQLYFTRCCWSGQAFPSKVNGFIETDGTSRLYFTVEQAQKKLRRSRQSVTRIFRELEHCGLICRRKQGLGRPAVITSTIQ